MKLGGLLRPYPVNISPKDLVLKIIDSREFEGRSKGLGFSLELKKSKFKRARDSRGFGTGLEAQESQQRARRILAIRCTKNEIEIHHTRAKTRGLSRFKSPEDTRRIGPPFPIKSLTRFQQSMDKITQTRGTEGGRRRGGGLEKQSPRTDYQSRS